MWNAFGVIFQWCAQILEILGAEQKQNQKPLSVSNVIEWFRQINWGNAHGQMHLEIYCIHPMISSKDYTGGPI